MIVRRSSMNARVWLVLLAFSGACAGGEAGDTPEAGGGSSSAENAAVATSAREDAGAAAGSDVGAGADVGRAASANPAPPEAALEVTLTRDDGTRAGPFAVPSGAGAPSLTQIGDFTAVSAIFGEASPIATSTLKTRAASTGTLRLDDLGETAEGLRLLFLFRGEPDGALEGQYESEEGEVTLTALEPGRIAGTFDGTFVRQHDDSRHRVRGSFDFRRER